MHGVLDPTYQHPARERWESLGRVVEPEEDPAVA